MVLIVSKEGQLANRILQASVFIANATEYKYNIIHLYFDEYYTFFSEKLDRNNIHFRVLGKRQNIFSKIVQRLTTIIVKILLKIKIRRLPFFEIIKHEGYEQGARPFDLADAGFIRKAKSKVVLVSGWRFSDSGSKNKYESLLKDIWTPNNEYLERIEQYYKKYKKDHDILIGVHIRGGDYKRFENGKWYYTPEQYFEKMRELAALQKFTGKKIAFVVCSNEKNISFERQDRFTVFNEERHFVEDLYLLAKCNYIIGPPSTFSMWASFYGNVPLCFIREMESQLRVDSFEVAIF